MPIITSLKFRPAGDVRVSLDDSSFLLDGDTAVQFGLRADMELTEEEADVLCRKAEEYFAYSKAIAALSAGDLSEKLLLRRLKEKGATDEASLLAVERVRNLGFLDEESYASRLACHYSETKHFGRTRVFQELQKHGIPRDICEDAVEALPSDSEVLPMYYQAHLSRTDLEDEREKKRAFDRLIRAGFSYEAVNRFFRQMR